MAGPPSVRAFLRLAAVLAIGLLAGIWTFVAPWIVGFPSVRPGQWTSSTWSMVWVGAIVIGVSSAGMVIALALAISAAPRQRPLTSLERDGG
ncbi:MAG: hypothetical protein DLM67_02735 [Candidatus Nephthysia bennettiae]|nr:MAG: hypothetical protein DLM67_02735 [Candidatus Dormibacteraeota bacterium]